MNMKKQLMTLTTIVAFAGSAFGQGQVTLANNSSSLIRVGNATNGTPAAIGSLLFQLYYGTPGTPADALAPVSPQVGTGTAFVGRIANTVITFPRTLFLLELQRRSKSGRGRVRI